MFCHKQALLALPDHCVTFFPCSIVVCHTYLQSISFNADRFHLLFCGFWNRDYNNPGWRGRDDDAVLACDYRIQLFSIKTVRACCCSLVILLNPCCLCFWFGSARTELAAAVLLGGRKMVAHSGSFLLLSSSLNMPRPRPQPQSQSQPIQRRYWEMPRRSWRVWFYDASKQGTAAVVVHVMNLFISNYQMKAVGE